MRQKTELFIERLYECNSHKQKLKSAMIKLEKYMPLNIDRYEGLSEVELSFLDQMIFRFSKLQDAMGDKLFPAILELSGEEVKSKTFIDRLNRLEELGLLNKDKWQELRKYRNEIAHEYSFNKEDIVNGINIIYNSIDTLFNYYHTIYRYCIERFDFVRNSKILNDT